MSLSAIAATLEQFCVWTWKTSLHASVLIALVLVIQFAFGNRLPVRLRYAFSLLVLLRLILPVAPATSFSVFNFGKHLASSLPALEIRPTTSMPAPSSAQSIDIPVKLTTAPVKASRFRVREVANTAWLSDRLAPSRGHRRCALLPHIYPCGGEERSFFRKCKEQPNGRIETSE